MQLPPSKSAPHVFNRWVALRPVFNTQFHRGFTLIWCFATPSQETSPFSGYDNLNAYHSVDVLSQYNAWYSFRWRSWSRCILQLLEVPSFTSKSFTRTDRWLACFASWPFSTLFKIFTDPNFLCPANFLSRHFSRVIPISTWQIISAHVGYLLQAEEAPWSNLYACGDCRRGASLVVTAIAEGRDCANRVDSMLMGSTSLPRAAPLAANPTFFQMPQKAMGEGFTELLEYLKSLHESELGRFPKNHLRQRCNFVDENQVLDAFWISSTAVEKLSIPRFLCR